jgi:peroxiredoxin
LVIALAFALVYVIRGEIRSRSEVPALPVGEVGKWEDGQNLPAPDFELATLEGDTLRISDLRGKIVVLNFWATWCAPCRAETPDLVELDREFRSRGVQFLGVSVDELETPVRAFVQEFGIRYPIIRDDGAAQSGYREITGYPTTYLINRQGEIEKFMPGVVSKSDLRSVLQDMLKEGEV